MLEIWGHRMHRVIARQTETPIPSMSRPCCLEAALCRTRARVEWRSMTILGPPGVVGRNPVELLPGLDSQPLPLLVRIRQHLPNPTISDVELTVREELTRVIGGSIRKGQRIALTAGSRGIAHIDRVLRAASAWVREEGGEPFIVAAMGSHGGASRAGQLAVLTGYGITEAAIGCPIVMEIETVEAGRTSMGCPVTMARAAWDADGIIVVNRVKPHTILRPPLGSGLMKMTALGLSGPRGADAIHSHGLSENLIPAARILLGSGKVTGGLALLENAKGQLARVEAVPVGDFERRDRALLQDAIALMPTIPMDPLDVVVVQRIGKDISGAGMDPNVIGMHRRLGGAPTREIARIVALELSPRSEGNAIGVGMADIVTDRLRNNIDWESTYINALTSDFLWGVKMPISFRSDREAIAAACRSFSPDRVRAVFARDTAHLETMYVTPALADGARRLPSFEVEDREEPIAFDSEGTLRLDF